MTIDFTARYEVEDPADACEVALVAWVLLIDTWPALDEGDRREIRTRACRTMSAATTGPAVAALRVWWPKLALQERYVARAAVLDRVGATGRQVEAAMQAVRDSRHVTDEWSYFEAVVRERLTRDWPELEGLA